MRISILLALLGSVLAQDAQLINDLEITRKLNHALLRGLREDGPTFPELLAEPALALSGFELPPSAVSDLDWHQVYRASQPGTVIVASGGRCDDCGKVHPRVASGFIVSASGLVVTNYHVVNLEASSPLVVLDGAGVVHEIAGWVKLSKNEDLAVLQLAGEGPFDFLPLAQEVPGAGSEVAVLGHPDKNFYFFSTGVVSRYFIQQGNRVPNLAVTAQFAKGSSGGPVLDRRGNVVGIVRATDSIYYTEHGAEQKDFQMVVRMVVPVDLLRKLLESPLMLRPVLACLFSLAICGCASETLVKEYTRPLAEGQNALVRVPSEQWPEMGHALGSPESLRQAVVHSLEFLSRPGSKQRFPVAGVSHARMQRSLQSFLELLDAGLQGPALDAALKQRFELYRSRGWDGSGEVLFTAYCEPIYAGSRTRSEKYRYPLYRLPEDLVKDAEGNTLGRQTDAGLVPYPARRELESSGMLRGLELAYLEDPFDPFVVQVQGSARIRLAEGGELRVGYAGKNGQPYTSIGGLLVERGKIPSARISLQAIRDYLAAHPQELQALLWENASFVFFTETEGGPYGSLNVPVIGGRSLASDRDIFPPAGLCFVETRLPFSEGNGFVFRNFAGFMCNQDTGGAIRSPGRADLFLGSGPEAERRAGHTKQEGRLYFLLAAGEAP